ncbi:MAG: methanogenesis marker 9 domain-containing protein [Methanocorpusculum sp.]|nr:methanogenesis marker 9 domain-containing protein [Methanocorpusculum sp.]MDD2470877.1 methanogenesis marker 9 domain-containing protein [Methanocorpusculum sp.]MDD3257408.1 methanogenesis marker 9 domain-containing protein [Methanocorpusculum sp.]MDD4132743.1 methanogenesis marker 9 domain-containing protein [Methanocorpusculum sp.]
MTGDTRFISINGRPVKTPIVLASMAGITDADYVLERSQHAGVAFIGGYNTDEASRKASAQMQSGGRPEFDADFNEIATEIAMLNGTDIILGLNLRGAAPEGFVAAVKRFGNSVIYEIDAHCRQQPMIDAGCGEYLMHNPEKLCGIVSALAKEGVTISVKIRSGVVDDRNLAKMLWKAGAHILHVDLMDTGYTKVRQIRNVCPLIIIANNSVTNTDRMMDYFSHGADLVSLARGANLPNLQTLDRYIRATAEEVGWYNAPKQLCRGGDVRSLTFCCMPVKQCPLLPALETFKLSREEYLSLKQSSTKETMLAEGSHTCFGSLAFCCKSTTPCMFRDMTLKSINLPKNDYMALKRTLSEKIVAHIFKNA